MNTIQIKKSLLTYVVKVDAQRQPSATAKYTFNWTSPSDPQGKYGDHFISGNALPNEDFTSSS